MEKNKIILITCFVVIFAFALTYGARSDSLGKFDFPIYDIHEHMGEGNLDTLLFAMEENDIAYTGVVGSSHFTLTLRDPGFEDFEKNNDFLLNISDKVLAFPTIDPRMDSLDYLKDQIEKGAKGLKLYSGHKSSFYKYLGPLDREEILPIYE